MGNVKSMLQPLEQAGKTPEFEELLQRYQHFLLDGIRAQPGRHRRAGDLPDDLGQPRRRRQPAPAGHGPAQGAQSRCRRASRPRPSTAPGSTRSRPSDRNLIKAFMRGVNQTAPLKFDHPGLGTTATHTDDKLVIQNDIGTTDAHVLVVHVVQDGGHDHLHRRAPPAADVLRKPVRALSRALGGHALAPGQQPRGRRLPL